MYIVTPRHSNLFYSAAVQIHFTGADHWVTSQLIGREVRVYDSLGADTLTSSMDEQLARIYKPFVANQWRIQGG